MKRILFIDRDGTIIAEPADFQIDAFEKLKFLPSAISSLAKIAAELDYELVMVTNQDGLGTPAFPEEKFASVHEFVMRTLAGEGVRFADVCIDRTFAHQNAPTRKPNIGMLTKYISGNFDLANSYVIGDRQTDIELAKNLGAKAIFIRNPNFVLAQNEADGVIAVDGWAEVYERLRRVERKAFHRRKTSETDILVEINIDGRGKSAISTGIAFLDHMLEQLARHGSLDLRIEAAGDLHIDEHHTIEDTAIALGEAFAAALKDKTGIGRYGFTLPMDDCLAQVAIDFGGRNWIVWNVDFKREMIGKMPTEMFFHFFKSFSDKAMCNLNIKAEGTNEHHKIEAIFKAFARAIRMAVRFDPFDQSVPSTKGIL